jgi:hypothetical protein
MKTIPLKRANLFALLFSSIIFLTSLSVKAQSLEPVGPVYQAIGVNGKTQIHKYNRETLEFELEATLEVVSAGAAFCAITRFVYIADKTSANKIIKVYNPVRNFSHVGDIKLQGNIQNINFGTNLFSGGNDVGFINGKNLVTFKVDRIFRYPATVTARVEQIKKQTSSTICGDYAMYNNKIYGITSKNTTGKILT